MGIFHVFQLIICFCMVFFCGMSRKVTEHTKDVANSLYIFFLVLTWIFILIG